MARSNATTVAQYLAALPADRRKELAAVRKLILKHLPKGYQETMGWGMISYGIPLADYPNTYNGQPLCFAALAAQKNFSTIYLMGAYASSKEYRALKSAFEKAGKKFDMGKSCLHFKRAADLELEAVAKVIAATPPKRFIAYFEKYRRT
jgi:uncharacterized protein YdhG (YjbR/CyaY superfamily)